MPIHNETGIKAVIVTLTVSLVCSVIVSATAVTLGTLREDNARRTRLLNIFSGLDLVSSDEKGLRKVQEGLQYLLLDLESCRQSFCIL